MRLRKRVFEVHKYTNNRRLILYILFLNNCEIHQQPAVSNKVTL
jgi:hypothetical protein